MLFKITNATQFTMDHTVHWLLGYLKRVKSFSGTWAQRAALFSVSKAPSEIPAYTVTGEIYWPRLVPVYFPAFADNKLRTCFGYSSKIILSVNSVKTLINQSAYYPTRQNNKRIKNKTVISAAFLLEVVCLLPVSIGFIHQIGRLLPSVLHAQVLNLMQTLCVRGRDISCTRNFIMGAAGGIFSVLIFIRGFLNTLTEKNTKNIVVTLSCIVNIVEWW